MNVYSKCLHPYIDSKGFAYGCGHCCSCRKSKSIEWNMRATHELIMNPKAVYFTLTYDNEHLPKGAINKMNDKDERGIICRKDVTNFIKRLRKKYKNIRYLYCAEYGPLTWRPHYHFVIFGIDYKDIKQKDLKDFWKNGRVDKSNEFVTEYCIAYISGYIRKKEKLKKAEDYYTNNGRPAPYLQASQGLGREWCFKNAESWTKTLKIGYRGFQLPIPRYYIKFIKKIEGRSIKYYKREFVDKTTNKYKSILRLFNSKIVKQDNYDPEIVKETVCYKVIENPFGIYTSRINKIIRKNVKEDSKKWINNYKITQEEKDTILKLYLNKYDNELKLKYLIWNDTEGLSDESLTKIYSIMVSKEVVRPIKRPKRYDSNIDDKLLVRLQDMAKHREIVNKRGVFGKRDLLDLCEINNIFIDKDEY